MKSIILFIGLCFPIFIFPQKVSVMQKHSNGKEFNIDVYAAFQNKAPILKTSQFVEDIEFVPLEITDDCLLSNHLKTIVVTSKDIIVYDYEGCYRFDRSGKFLNKIGSRGQGPGEYIKAMSVTVDTLNQWVYFPDHHGNRIVKYDFSGKHLINLKGINVGSRIYIHKPMELLVEDDYYQFSKKGKRFCLGLYSEKEKRTLSKMSCDYQHDIPRMAMCDPIAYSFKGALYAKDFWCDTIYRVTNSFRLDAYAVIDRGKFQHRTTNDESLITGKHDSQERMILGINRMNETDRYIFMSSSQGFCIYDKQMKKTFAGDSKENKLCVEDDLYGSPGFRGDCFPSNMNGNEYYTFRHAHEFIENGKGKHSVTGQKYDTYLKMIEKLDEEDNPVVMIVKMKK